jgi:hypothetical protein
MRNEMLTKQAGHIGIPTEGPDKADHYRASH